MLNAASEYRRAFACLPEVGLDVYSRCLNRDDPESGLLIERGREALEILQSAAGCTACDWGKQAEEGINVEDFSGARCLAMLAMLRADTSFREGDDQSGLDDLVAVMALGRHIAQGKRVSGLAGFPIEDLAVKKAFEVLGRLDSETRRAFGSGSALFRRFPIMRARFVPSKVIFGQITATCSPPSTTTTRRRRYARSSDSAWRPRRIPPSSTSSSRQAIQPSEC